MSFRVLVNSTGCDFVSLCCEGEEGNAEHTARKRVWEK